MFESLTRELHRVINQLFPQEVEAFGFQHTECPFCQVQLQQGWVRSQQPLYFSEGSWQDPPPFWATPQQGTPLRNRFRLQHAFGAPFLAAARCRRCKMVFVKYETEQGFLT